MTTLETYRCHSCGIFVPDLRATCPRCGTPAPLDPYDPDPPGVLTLAKLKKAMDFIRTANPDWDTLRW